jgi:hypothetical protein
MSPRIGMLINCIAVIFVPAVALLGAVYYAISRRTAATPESDAQHQPT